MSPGLLAAVDWYRERGVFPRSSGRGLTPEESAAGNALQKARAKSSLHREALDELVPGWRDVRKGPRTDGPPRRLRDLKAFVDEHGRMPSRATRADPAEVRVAEGLHAARNGYYPHHEAWLDAVLPGWREGRRRG